MAIINQSNILNLQPGITAPVVVHMSEGDTGTKLSFKLIDGARAWTDPGNVVAAVHGRRQDGTQFGPYACVISGDTVSFETDPAMAAVAGSGIAQIVLTDSNSATAGSANFAVMIERATFPMGVTYTNDKSVYEAILAYTQRIPAQVMDNVTAKIDAEVVAREAADAAINTELTGLENRLASEVATLAQQDDVLSARMDTFTQLPDGSLSTAADAEMVDIRVMTDGQTADTAGNAVRTQITTLSEEIVATGKKLGVYAGKFRTDGAAHSSTKDVLSVDIAAGESFTISVSINITTTSNYQCWALYADGTAALIKTGNFGEEYTLTDAKAITGFGITVAKQSEAYSCLVVVDTESSVVNAYPRLESAVDRIDQVIYSTFLDIEQGYWATTNGAAVNSADWVRTVGYIPKHYIYNAAPYRSYVCAYDKDGTYIGLWNGSGFTTTYAVSYGLYEVNIPKLNKLYPEYEFVTSIHTNGGAITPADIYEVLTVKDTSVIDPSGIVELNSRAEESLLQAKRTINIESNQYLSATQPLVLLHFSDIHAATANLRRIVEYRDHIADKIDDTICTGDMVADRFNNGMAFWDSVSGTENILMLIGNHDALAGDSGYDWTNTVTQQQQYDRFIAPYVANWNCTYTSGLTYYYKDYAEKKVRLICLNCMLKDADAAAQLAWLNSTMEAAKALDYYVIIAVHYPISDSTVIECNFSSLDKTPSQTQLGTEYMQAVDDFVTNGGKFVCYIAGHTHWDDMLKATNYDQLCIVIDAASMAAGNQWGDTMRTEGTKSQDCANLFVFDSASGVIKIIRVGADMDHYLREKNCITIKCSDNSILTQN